jgi:hypothetical protein
MKQLYCDGVVKFSLLIEHCVVFSGTCILLTSVLAVLMAPGWPKKVATMHDNNVVYPMQRRLVHQVIVFHILLDQAFDPKVHYC